ncbi:hypothetical protein CW700_07745 [Candidatus Bathyarchaeota archaeon]|nr:MAG: hypothetical protein CW700_07745 [Candidatus Bathyarchaeota archaeon]
MEDPKKTILNLLRENWDASEVGFTPRFSVDWYDGEEELPQVVVTRLTEDQRALGLTGDPSTAERRVEGLYAIDVWSKGDQARRWSMIEEVDRILRERCTTPGGDLKFLEARSWRDLDEVDVSPKLFRTQIIVRVVYNR